MFTSTPSPIRVTLCFIAWGALCTAWPLPSHAAPAAAPAPPPVSSTPGAREVPPAEELAYTRALKAYRGEMSAAEVEELAQTDPGPLVRTSQKTLADDALVRFFASLPDEAHARLRRDGYLKWRANALNATQKRWLKEMVVLAGTVGTGPFPLDGKECATTGFIRVQVEEQEEPVYSWWIDARKSPRPAWAPLVNVVGIGREDFLAAHRKQIAALAEQPETPPVAVKELAALPLVKPVKEAAEASPAVEKPAPLMDERAYWSLVKAYRGDLGGEALRLLAAGDSLTARRLKLLDPAERALNRFFARLPDKEHRTLLTTGLLVWRPEQLSKEERKLLEPLIVRLNGEARGGGAAQDPYSLEPLQPTRLGFALVRVPGVEKPVLSWWVRSATALHPAWISLNNGAALDAKGYFRAHLEQLSALE